jgi:hypothetical protein
MLNKRKLLMKDVLELLQLNNTYDERIKEIEDYMNKNNSYTILNLNVASSSLNSKTVFYITPYGMTNDDTDNIRNCILLFGYEKSTDQGIPEEKQSCSVHWNFSGRKQTAGTIMVKKWLQRL